MNQPKLQSFLPAIGLALLGLAVFSITSAPHQEAYSLRTIERAITPAEHAQGLSGRTDIPEEYGMLFIFEEKDVYAFWMKDMYVPIDIIWLSDTGAIVGIDGAVATSTFPNAYDAPEPVRYVLETRAGTAAAKGWNVGTMLSLPLTR